MNNISRIDTLTSLRAFAAGALLYFHQNVVIVPVQSDVTYALGVSFFFVLSGFILFINYQELPPNQVRRYFVARFARLYPVHIFTMVMFGLVFAAPIFLDKEWLPIIFLNALLVQSWVPILGLNFSMNSVAWSVSTELAFYLAFPWLSRRRNFGLTFLCILVLTVALILIVERIDNGTVPPKTRWELSPNDFILMSPLIRIAEFACGMWFARLYRAGLFSNFIRRYGTSAEIIALAGLALFCIFHHDMRLFFRLREHPLIGIWVETSGGMFAFGFLLMVFAHQAGIFSRFLRTRVMVFLGESSFALYMLHFIVINIFTIFKLMESYHWSVRFATICAFTYVGSWLLFLLVEKPCRYLIMRLAAKRPANEALATPVTESVQRVT